MDRRIFLGASAAFTAAMALFHTTDAHAAQAAGDGTLLPLPEPDKKGGKPLMACLNERRSRHQPGKRELSMQDLSNILWAAWGINNDKGKRTIPTARNRQLMQVYAVLLDGVWLYMPEQHQLKRVLMGDHRSTFDNSACILLYMAPTYEKFSAMHVGSAYQNVGLYCASANLKNCVKYQRATALDAELPHDPGWDTFICHSISA